MNGSEDGEVLPAAVLSGAPIELEARTVRYDYTLDCICRQHLTKPASTARPKPQLSQAIGTVTTGVWTGTSYQKATDGRIP
jgi:hypothetical protein